MKKMIAALGLAALMSVGTAHAQTVDIVIATNPDNLGEHHVLQADRSADSQIERVVSGPIVACATDMAPETACIPVLPGETLVMRSGTLTTLPTGEAGPCSRTDGLDLSPVIKRIICTQ